MAAAITAGPAPPQLDLLPAGHALLLGLAATGELALAALQQPQGAARPARRRRRPQFASVSVRRKPQQALSAPGAAGSAAVHQAVAGGVAGAVSKTLVAPLERAGILLMAGRARASRGLVGVAHAMWGDGGLRGLFRGNSAALAKVVPASALSFAVFSGVKGALLARRAAAGGGAGAPPELSALERLLAGGAAGAAAATLTYPLDRLRCVMAVGGGRGGLAAALRALLRGAGPAGLYSGYLPTLLSDITGSALGFTLYDTLSRAYRKRTGSAPPPAAQGAIGAAAALCTLTATMPLEVVRRRLQAQGAAGHPVLYRNGLHCLRAVLREEGGLAGLYRAALPLYLKVPLSIGVTYILHEALVSRLAALQPPERPAAARAAAPA